MKLDSSQVLFHPLSYADPSGRLFWWEGGLYRAISSERVPFYEQILSQGIIRDLVRRKLIVDTEGTDLELDGYGLVLKHCTVPFVSYCYEWCGEMLKVAALSVLELERELLNYGLTLQDAHPWNILFVGAAPVWVDLGSLVIAGHRELWYAHEEFLAYFTRPLKIMAAGHSRVARWLLRDEYCGVKQSEVEALTSLASAKLIKTLLKGAKSSARIVMPRTFRPIVHWAARHMTHSTRDQIDSVERAVREIENIRFDQPSTMWSNYYGIDFPDFVDTADWTGKHRSIAQILSAKRPDSVLDIGSNRGWYSQLAARSGAQVVSIDCDEPSVTKLFFDAVREQLPLLPLLGDFRTLNPMIRTLNPMTSGRGIAALERLCCHMVLALALVHHLVFKQFLNFDQIVQGLSAFARKWLVIEFVGCDDPYVQEWMSGRFCWYSLDNLRTALAKEFRHIWAFPSETEHRHILLCER